MLITIDMDEKDFDALCMNSMRWHAINWQSQADRFENVTSTYDTPPRWDWEMVYWLGESWANVMLCRAFLKAQGADYEIIYDLTDAGEYMILTGYKNARLAGHATGRGKEHAMTYITTDSTAGSPQFGHAWTTVDGISANVYLNESRATRLVFDSPEDARQTAAEIIKAAEAMERLAEQNSHRPLLDPSRYAEPGPTAAEHGWDVHLPATP